MYDLLVSFLVGVVASAAVGVLIYFRQKRDAERTERSNFMLQYHQWKLTRDTRSSVHTVARNQTELLDEFHRLRKELTFALSQNRLSSASSLAERYEAVADEYGVLSVSRLLVRPQSTTNLTLDLLKNIHFQLFPPDYEMGGSLRRIQNMIMDMSGRDPTVRFRPPPPDQVDRLTEQLLSDWRENYATVTQSSPQEKLAAIAAFHHGFLSIHPFVDGNGRLARLLLTLQVKELLGKTVRDDWPRKEYYDALLKADGGDVTNLVHVIEEVIIDRAEQPTQPDK